MDEMLTSALAGSVGAIAVLGEPGIGKTSMFDVLCERAAAAGFDVLTGRGSEFERDVPYGLVVEAIDERFREFESEVIGGLDQDRLAELAAVLPSLSGRGGKPASRLDVERFEFHRAVRATFERLVRSRPLLLALDDVHWADPASVELIGHLLRRSVPGMVLALAYRPRQAPRMLLAAVEQAAREGFLRELELAPLTVSEAADMLGRQLDTSTVRSLHAESGGNPFYLEQLARMTRKDPAVTSRSAWVHREDGTGIPAAVRATLARELVVLPAHTLVVLQSAAVAGDPFDVGPLAEIADAEDTRVLEYLDALVAVDLVRMTDTAGRFRFRHPIVRRVVYDGAGPGWRLGAHKRAALALARRGASLGVRAHHVERSASVGDEDAVAILTDAGRAVAARAPAAAARWFEAALRLLTETSEPERQLPLVISLAGALASCGRLRDSRATLERALELIPADSPGFRVQIIGMIARADLGMGRAEQARRLITTALEQATPDSADAVRLCRDLAENQLMMREWNQAIDTTRHARTQAQTLGDPELLLAATSTLAWLTGYGDNNVAEAQELAGLAAEGMDARDVDLTPELLDALADLAYAEVCIDRYRAASRHSERGLQVSRATGHGYAFGRLALSAAASKLWLGQLHDARSAAETAVEAALLLDNDQLLSTAEALRCWVETLRGDLAAALAAGRAAVQAADRQPDALFAWMAHACYGEALIEAGEPERGCLEILSASGPELSQIPPNARVFWSQALITAELSVGGIDAAEATARRIEQTASGLPSRQANVHYAHARILLAQGDYGSAAAPALEAAQCFDAAEMRIWSARAQLIAGRSLAHAGQQAAAIRELERAHGIFHDAGAERLRDEAAKELRNLGRRVHRQPTAKELVHPPILTEREHGIAKLVLQGYTNREIAAELFVSPKTVEKHLARIFTKLGISSRAGVATALSRHRTDPS